MRWINNLASKPSVFGSDNLSRPGTDSQHQHSDGKCCHFPYYFIAFSYHETIQCKTFAQDSWVTCPKTLLWSSLLPSSFIGSCHDSRYNHVDHISKPSFIHPLLPYSFILSSPPQPPAHKILGHPTQSIHHVHPCVTILIHSSFILSSQQQPQPQPPAHQILSHPTHSIHHLHPHLELRSRSTSSKTTPQPALTWDKTYSSTQALPFKKLTASQNSNSKSSSLQSATQIPISLWRPLEWLATNVLFLKRVLKLM